MKIFAIMNGDKFVGEGVEWTRGGVTWRDFNMPMDLTAVNIDEMAKVLRRECRVVEFGCVEAMPGASEIQSSLPLPLALLHETCANGGGRYGIDITPEEAKATHAAIERILESRDAEALKAFEVVVTSGTGLQQKMTAAGTLRWNGFEVEVRRRRVEPGDPPHLVDDRGAAPSGKLISERVKELAEERRTSRYHVGEMVLDDELLKDICQALDERFGRS